MKDDAETKQQFERKVMQITDRKERQMMLKDS